jgi:hypothetical protein
MTTALGNLHRGARELADVLACHNQEGARAGPEPHGAVARAGQWIRPGGRSARTSR